MKTEGDSKEGPPEEHADGTDEVVSRASEQAADGDLD